MKRDLGWTEMQTQVYWHSWCPDNGDAKFFLNRHKFLPSGQTGTWLVQYCVNWEMYHKLTFWYTFQFSVVDSPSRIFSSEPVVSSYNPQTVWRCGGGNVWHQRKRTIDGEHAWGFVVTEWSWLFGAWGHSLQALSYCGKRPKQCCWAGTYLPSINFCFSSIIPQYWSTLTLHFFIDMD